MTFYRDFPELAEDLRNRGYIKELLVGEELFDASGANKNHKNAYAVAHPDGRIYFRRLPANLKSPDNRSRLWENWITTEFQTDPQQAALALFLHEAAHQYHFNAPELGAGSTVEKLFQKAKTQNRSITKYARVDVREYFAESFVAALLHPMELDKRDPEMGSFMKKWFAGKGIKKP